jgi:hypothetical protein
MIDVVYKLVHFQPFEGYEILGEYDTEEEADARKAELLERAPREWLTIARVPRITAADRRAADAEENQNKEKV